MVTRRTTKAGEVKRMKEKAGKLKKRENVKMNKQNNSN